MFDYLYCPLNRSIHFKTGESGKDVGGVYADSFVDEVLIVLIGGLGDNKFAISMTKADHLTFEKDIRREVKWVKNQQPLKTARYILRRPRTSVDRTVEQVLPTDSFRSRFQVYEVADHVERLKSVWVDGLGIHLSSTEEEPRVVRHPLHETLNLIYEVNRFLTAGNEAQEISITPVLHKASGWKPQEELAAGDFELCLPAQKRFHSMQITKGTPQKDVEVAVVALCQNDDLYKHFISSSNKLWATIKKQGPLLYNYIQKRPDDEHFTEEEIQNFQKEEEEREKQRLAQREKEAKAKSDSPPLSPPEFDPADELEFPVLQEGLSTEAS
eukprot:GCRY01002904.1.p1 GENE.GCRY01002904.1~~GCRY01002904.1.p1  ORF type:complete len:374 (-),score=40.45 GCRY01002904.1:1063-2043(-)